MIYSIDELGRTLVVLFRPAGVFSRGYHHIIVRILLYHKLHPAHTILITIGCHPRPCLCVQINHPVVPGAVHRTLTLFNSRALFGSYSRLNDATDALDSGLVFIRIVLRIVIQLLASQTRAGREGLVGFDCPYEICLS